ncbi:Gly-Xaa carboxypeptidase [Stylosanthes scabra]|uniref:Gly-Xaa carboxypeptidase n=1 Tax=Stylosanthes scabra TaxID=79078 RepID=A0ABU6XQC8_9FABA|nr:Gly-Xaa carboxypeptidase [Stylosanthes scabra]
MEIVRWHSEIGLEEFGVSKERVLQTYFVAAASIFEPQRWLERLAWTKPTTLIVAFKFHIKDDVEAKRVILKQFNYCINKHDSSSIRMPDENNKTEQLVSMLLITLDHPGLDSF